VEDSEGEGSDFEPSGSPFADDAAQHDPRQTVDTPLARSTDSTHPSAFRKMFVLESEGREDLLVPQLRLAASLTDNSSSSLPSTDKPGSPVSLNTDKQDSSTTRKKERSGIQDNERGNKARTPRRSSAAATPDIWDVPGSSLSIRSAKLKTCGKQNRARFLSSPSLNVDPMPSSLAETSVKYVEDHSPLPARKRQKLESQRICRGSESSPQVADDRQQHTLEVSLSQPRMTRSQREEYMIVKSPAGTGQRSSGAVTLSTIAYPTPEAAEASTVHDANDDHETLKTNASRRRSSNITAGMSLDEVWTPKGCASS
jgi:hypothetical protein